MLSPPRKSLVFDIEDELIWDTSPGGPEPDYLKWLDFEVMMASANAEEENYDASTDAIRNAWKTYYEAIAATFKLMELAAESPGLFAEISNDFWIMPCLMGVHPGAKKFNDELFARSRVGESNKYRDGVSHSKHLAFQPWPVRYAHAITNTIDLTLDRWSSELPFLAREYGYGVRHPVDPTEIEEFLARGDFTEAKKVELRHKYRGLYCILPKWTEGLLTLPRPFSLKTVDAYWRKGKELLLEDLPEFHLRPEWKSYHTRRYKNGAKAGVIQHAIFKDILVAMRTIARGNVRAELRKISRKAKTSG